MLAYYLLCGEYYDHVLLCFSDQTWDHSHTLLDCSICRACRACLKPLKSSTRRSTMNEFQAHFHSYNLISTMKHNRVSTLAVWHCLYSIYNFMKIFIHRKVANNRKKTTMEINNRKKTKCYLLYITHLHIVESVIIFIVLVSKFSVLFSAWHSAVKT